MRQLATIQKIKNLQPIEGKDRIELATILGWKVIVQKGQFKVNDLCIYIETDSLLPEWPEFEFLRSRCYSKKWEGFRIRCMKMGNVYSEGIVFPLNILPDEWWDVPGETFPYGVDIGSDVSDILQIKKYDPQMITENKIVKEIKSKNIFIRFLFKFKFFRNLLLKKHIKLKFPSHLVSKTDEIRIQAIPFVLEDYKGTICTITEKADGCSVTYIYNKNKFMVCSRNIEVVNKDSNYWKIAEKYKIKEILKNNKDLAIQGEIIGPGVANGAGRNIYQLKELDFYIFNIVNTKNRQLLSFNEIKKFCTVNGLKLAPVINENYILGSHNVDELLEMAKGESKIFGVEREGIVIRDYENKYCPIEKVGDHLSFKVINQDYLLKYCNKTE